MKFIKLKSSFDNTDVLINVKEITHCETDCLDKDNTSIWFRNGKCITVKQSIDKILQMLVEMNGVL